jgi:hypothetical protein
LTGDGSLAATGLDSLHRDNTQAHGSARHARYRRRPRSDLGERARPVSSLPAIPSSPKLKPSKSGVGHQSTRQRRWTGVIAFVALRSSGAGDGGRLVRRHRHRQLVARRDDRSRGMRSSRGWRGCRTAEFWR